MIDRPKMQYIFNVYILMSLGWNIHSWNYHQCPKPNYPLQKFPLSYFFIRMLNINQFLQFLPTCGKLSLHTFAPEIFYVLWNHLYIFFSIFTLCWKVTFAILLPIFIFILLLCFFCLSVFSHMNILYQYLEFLHLGKLL